MTEQVKLVGISDVMEDNASGVVLVVATAFVVNVSFSSVVSVTIVRLVSVAGVVVTIVLISSVAGMIVTIMVVVVVLGRQGAKAGHQAAKYD